MADNDLQHIELSDRFHQSDQMFFNLMPSNIVDRKHELLKYKEVAYVSDFYRIENATDEFCLTGKISVQLKPTTNLNRFYKILQQNNLEVVRDDRFTSGMYLLEPLRPEIDIVSLANRLFETGLFRFSSPDRFTQLHMY